MDNETMVAVTLKPCPFCGSSNIDATGWASTDAKGPACDDCGASAGQVSQSHADNIAAWNHRHQSGRTGAGEALATVNAILEAAPELNPSNYDHDQVCELNAAMVEACLFSRAALSQSTAGEDGA